MHTRVSNFWFVAKFQFIRKEIQNKNKLLMKNTHFI